MPLLPLESEVFLEARSLFPLRSLVRIPPLSQPGLHSQSAPISFNRMSADSLTSSFLLPKDI